MRLRGKGRAGGKRRTLPIGPTVVGVLLERTATLRPIDPIYAHHGKTLHSDLEAASPRAGIQKTTGHDPRRSFDRIAYYADANLVGLKHLYGHELVEMTAYYVGLDEAQMRHDRQVRERDGRSGRGRRIAQSYEESGIRPDGCHCSSVGRAADS